MALLLALLLYAVVLTIALSRRGLAVSAGPPRARASTSHRTISNLLVVGATGATGRELVSQALERQYMVTALVRNPARLDLTHRRLRVVRGDVLDPASVAAAMVGQDAVVSALGHKRFLFPGRILSEGTRILLGEMATAGVSRFICLTSLGIGDSAGRLGLYYTLFVIPLVLQRYFWDKARQERAIAASETDWVIVRPGALSSRPARGRCQHGRRVGSFLWTLGIPRADVARFMLDQLSDDQYLGAAVGICS